jgi:hypothetical protein
MVPVTAMPVATEAQVTYLASYRDGNIRSWQADAGSSQEDFG